MRTWRSARQPFSRRSPTTSTPRGRSASCSSWSPRGTGDRSAGAHAAVERLLPLLGLEALAAVPESADAEAERLLAERERARSDRDFERADALRDELASRGWEVRDTPEGARLVRAG